MPRRFALLVEYDGTNYVGWQRQLNGLSVQERLERTITRLTGEPCAVTGAGRTDSGVHGFGQVAHVDIPDSWTTPVDKIARVVSSALPDDVRVRAAAYVRDDFHARFDAVFREYRYTLCEQQSVFRHRYVWQPRRPFKPALLQAAADVFVGTHDFTTFSKLNADNEHHLCAVEWACWRERETGVWDFHIRANRFVYGMVRSLVAAMVDVAWEVRSVEDIRAALAARDRLLNSQLAPPEGLTLWRVGYADDPFSHLYA